MSSVGEGGWRFQTFSFVPFLVGFTLLIEVENVTPNGNGNNAYFTICRSM